MGSSYFDTPWESYCKEGGRFVVWRFVNDKPKAIWKSDLVWKLVLERKEEMMLEIDCSRVYENSDHDGRC